MPVVRLFSVLNFFETGSGTFFGTKFFRDRFRDFFRYQIFSRPVPRLFSVPNFFETGSNTIKKIEQFPGTGIPGTGMSHSGVHLNAMLQKCEKVDCHIGRKNFLPKTKIHLAGAFLCKTRGCGVGDVRKAEFSAEPQLR